MPHKIADTTMQKVRRFLAALHIPYSPYATTDETLGVLVAKIKEHRHDEQLRAHLRALLDELYADGDALPAASCETVDPTDLARELTALIHPEQNVPAFAMPRTFAMLMFIAVLLLGMSLFAACQDDPSADNDDDEDTAACVDDLSLDNFIDIIDHGQDIPYEDRTAAIEDYASMNDNQREALLEQLCGMTPEQIAAAIEQMTAEGDDDSVTTDDDSSDDDATVVDDDDDSADDDYFDDDVAYKGVTF
ncbi:MAG TPA: hypothetical protein PKW95_01070 [bacterium]|nr:hypothetical protein [bacterium]